MEETLEWISLYDVPTESLFRIVLNQYEWMDRWFNLFQWNVSIKPKTIKLEAVEHTQGNLVYKKSDPFYYDMDGLDGYYSTILVWVGIWRVKVLQAMESDGRSVNDKRKLYEAWNKFLFDIKEKWQITEEAMLKHTVLPE